MNQDTSPGSGLLPERQARAGFPGRGILILTILVAFALLLLPGCDSVPSDFESGSTAELENRPAGARDPIVTSSLTTASPEALYQHNCAVCHGGNGGGNVGPALAGNRNLASSVYVVARIQLGGGGMPPFARLLSGEEIAAAASFVRTSWENRFGTVSVDQVDLQWHGYRRGQRYGTLVPDGL